MWICSGVFFSAQRFPAMFQPFVKALPLTAVIDALRASMLQGVALSHLAPQLAVIICWMVICFFTALKLFKWK
jgi:ABC-type polysaccharide/polyol phosphate export permease